MLNLFPFGAATFVVVVAGFLWHYFITPYVSVEQWRMPRNGIGSPEFLKLFLFLTEEKNKQTNNRLHNPNCVGKTNKCTKSVIVFMFTVLKVFSFVFFFSWSYVYVNVSLFLFSVILFSVYRSTAAAGSMARKWRARRWSIRTQYRRCNWKSTIVASRATIRSQCNIHLSSRKYNPRWTQRK